MQILRIAPFFRFPAQYMILHFIEFSQLLFINLYIYNPVDFFQTIQYIRTRVSKETHTYLALELFINPRFNFLPESTWSGPSMTSPWTRPSSRRSCSSTTWWPTRCWTSWPRRSGKRLPRPTGVSSWPASTPSRSLRARESVSSTDSGIRTRHFLSSNTRH